MDLSTSGYLAATHKGQMQPIVPKCCQTHTFSGTFSKFDPHCVYVVRFAVSDKHILWLELWLLSSTGLPVQSDCRSFYFRKSACREHSVRHPRSKRKKRTAEIIYGIAKTIENTQQNKRTKISEPMGSQNHRECQTN